MARSATLPPAQQPPAKVLSILGRRPTSRPTLRLPPISAPEEPLLIEFVGLSPEAQQRALSGWPGAMRFSLLTAQPRAS